MSPSIPNPLGPERLVRVTGFGMTAGADGYWFRPTRVEEIQEVLNLARTTGRQVVLRGAGRSYGDANIAQEALVLDLARLNRVRSWDPETGIVEAEAGLTIEGLWRYCLEDGWWPPVVSGTMYPTLGGALAMNIHGKNGWKVGTLGEQVIGLDVVFPTGERAWLTPDDRRFWCVISSAGLLGIIVGVRLRMKRIASGDLEVLALAPRNWDEQFATFERLHDSADYMVTWIDAFARGAQAGRGEFHAAWYPHPQPGTLGPTFRADHQDLPDTILGFFPKSVVWRFLKPLNNRLGMRQLNAAKFRAATLLGHGKRKDQSLVGFSFLLDYVPHWRNSYLPGGFVQYQTFVPAAEAPRVFATQVEWQQKSHLESFLAVMKRHRRDEFLFSHGVDGYSLALDFKVTAGNRDRLWALAHRMNELVLNAGGRFYLAKDSTLRPEDFAGSVGETAMGAYWAMKAECDPEGLLTSALAQRLGLDPRRR